MSRPKIVNFDFGKVKATSKVTEEKEKEADELILVDAFWEKNGMKIRFIPHQEDVVTLIVVFVFRYDDPEHDKDKAVFQLNIEIPDSVYSQQKPFTIKGSEISRKLKARDGSCIKAANGNNCYYCEIKNFSSDMSLCNTDCIEYE